MKMSSTILFDISRKYVQDNQALIGKEATDRILGWIRSRSLPHLTSVCESSMPALASKDTVRVLMQIEAFFKKNALFADPVKCSQACVDSFLEAENKCAVTNRRLDNHYRDRDFLSPDIMLWVDRMQADIASCLGSYRTFLDSVPSRIRFTSGATSTRSRRNSRPHEKVSLRPRGSYSTHLYLSTLAESLGYKVYKGRLSTFNRVEEVLKNWETNRMIACENEGDLILQLAFDSYAKERLRSYFGVDLSDQSRNQRLAHVGSLGSDFNEYEIATADLKWASDTCAYNAVALLFPFEFFSYLAQCRARNGHLPDGRMLRYEKFSSMGNGSTFAIESLIFAAACRALKPKTWSVYGDDIIIDSDCVDDLARLLAYLGFELNMKKTHVTGPFRESCGGNFYEGSDVTPFYVRDFDSRKANQCHLVNGLAGVAVPGGELWKFLLLLTEKWKLPLVPYNYSSTSGVWIEPYFAYAEKKLRSRHGMLQFKGLVPRNRSTYVGDSRCLFLWHLDAISREPRAGISTLGRVRGSVTHPVEITNVVRSEAPSPSFKYVRKWIYWNVPVAVTPLHLTWWSEDLTRRKAS